jgi:molecular chaperone DnaJ
LDVPVRATPDEIRRAYKSKAILLHPDKNPGDPEAESRFAALGEAYRVLSDPQARTDYDRRTFGSIDTNRYSSIFGKPSTASGFGTGGERELPPGEDIELIHKIPLDSWRSGGVIQVDYSRKVKCHSCSGYGGTGLLKCSCADGKVKVPAIHDSGKMWDLVDCTICDGTGKAVSKPCPECRRKGVILTKDSVKISLDPMVPPAHRLRASGYGHAAKGNAPNGNLYVTIGILQDPKDSKTWVDGDAIHTTVEIDAHDFTEGNISDSIDVEFMGSIHTLNFGVRLVDHRQEREFAGWKLIFHVKPVAWRKTHYLWDEKAEES